MSHGPGVMHGIAIRKIDDDEADRLRDEIVRTILRRIIAGARGNLDPAAFLNGGWDQFDGFVAALLHGGTHPTLTAWERAKANAGRPLPSYEIHARRLAVLMVTALSRIGLATGAARQFAADELFRAGVFDEPVSRSTVKHWQQRDYATLTPDDELLLATGIATAGRNAQAIARYFVGLCHLVRNPSAVAVR